MAGHVVVMDEVFKVPYTYRMVCLANSKKPGGTCVAGKVSEGKYQGYWIRPVAPRADNAITWQDQVYGNGQAPKLLDLVEINYTGLEGHGFQQENHLIDVSVRWSCLGHFPRQNLSLLEDAPASLWETTHDDSYSGENDRVNQSHLTGHRGTLYLIRPTRVRIRVSAEGSYRGDNRLVLRAFFHYNNIYYGLKVTDTLYVSRFRERGAGTYDVDNIEFFTISLGEIANDGYAYKLVAAIYERV